VVVHDSLYTTNPAQPLPGGPHRQPSPDRHCQSFALLQPSGPDLFVELELTVFALNIADPPPERMSMKDTKFIGIIGGSGFAALEDIEILETRTVSTPWGPPSSPITLARVPTASSSHVRIAFISRHGLHHTITPSQIPNRANIAALAHLKVHCILAFSAVGSLQEYIHPRDFVLPTQVIDRTHGVRASTFFDNGIVAHTSFADPFDATLIRILQSCEAAITESTLHVGGTLVCMGGPAFSTRAESELYRAWGGKVINMSCLPECTLAAEAEIPYAMICMSTDYDCWKTDEPPVDVARVIANVSTNTQNAHRLIRAAMEHIAVDASIGESLGARRGTMRHACVTAPHARNQKALEDLEYILPGYFS